MSQEIIDMGWDKYLKELENDDFNHVDVGIIASDGAQKAGDGDLTLAQLATIQEVGTVINVTKKMRGYLHYNGLHLSPKTKEITIPSRSYVRGTFDENLSILISLVEEQEKQIQDGNQTRKRALTMIGQTHQNQIQKAMSTTGKFKANHPFTIARKNGKDTPLINTGRLRQAINFEVG